MTYAGFEVSREDGAPLELYLFELSGVAFAYTNGEATWTYDSNDYIPQYVKRGSITNEADKAGQQIEVNMPAANDFAQLYVGVVPGERASLKIYQVHRTDTPGFETKQIFEGVVSTVAYTKNGKESKIICRPLTSAGERPIPRRTYQGVCNHVLFDGRCGLLEVTYQETGTATVVSGRDITITGLTNAVTGDYWEAGYVEFGNERRLIVGQTANVFKLNLEFKESPVGETVRVLPGCKLRRVTDCSTKFNNVKNFGGFSYVPLKNPFETGID